MASRAAASGMATDYRGDRGPAHENLRSAEGERRLTARAPCQFQDAVDTRFSQERGRARLVKLAVCSFHRSRGQRGEMCSSALLPRTHCDERERRLTAEEQVS